MLYLKFSKFQFWPEQWSPKMECAISLLYSIYAFSQSSTTLLCCKWILCQIFNIQMNVLPWFCIFRIARLVQEVQLVSRSKSMIWYFLDQGKVHSHDFCVYKNTIKCWKTSKYFNVRAWMHLINTQQRMQKEALFHK